MRKKNRVRLGSSVLMTSLLLIQGTATFASLQAGKEGRSAAQNFSTVQGEASPQQKEALNKAGQISGSISLNVPHAALDKAVQAAKDAGLILVQDDDVNVGNAKGKSDIDKLVSTVKDKYTDQVSRLKTAVTNYQNALNGYLQQSDGQPGGPMWETNSPVAQYMGLAATNPEATIEKAAISGGGNFLKSSAIAFASDKDNQNIKDWNAIASAPDVGIVQGTNGKTFNGFNVSLEPGATITVTYANLAKSLVGGDTPDKIQISYKNVNAIKMAMFISTDPVQGNWFGVNTDKNWDNQPLSVKQTNIYLDSSGKALVLSPDVKHRAQFFVGSLNYSSALGPNNDIKVPSDINGGFDSHESASFTSDSTQIALRNSSVSKAPGLPISGLGGPSIDGYGANPAGTTETWAATTRNDISNPLIPNSPNVSEWDGMGNDGPKAYFGALDQLINVGETSATVQFNTTTGQMWYLYSTSIKWLPPLAPTFHWHYYKATAQPENLKTVSGTDGQNLDGQLVNKQQIEDWHLTSDPLPTYRDARKDLTITDVLPNGFVPDVDRTKALSPDYEVTYDEASNTMTFTAPQALLDKANADLTKEWAIPAPVIESKVTNDDALYQNDFTLKTNDFTVTSNIASVHTPGGDNTPPPGGPDNPGNPDQPNTPKPSKTNENAAGNTIDGQGISSQATNFYKMTWDLKPYENIASSKDDIARGFYFIDDAPEVVNVDAKNTKYEDANGKPFEDIYATLYNEVNDAPTDVQVRLKRDGLAPKGQFVYYNVSDPQSFYTNYVQKGINIVIKTPMTFKAGATGDYENVDYQSDFGNGYEGDTVKNHIVPPTVKKFVSIDGGHTWQTTDQLKAKDSTYDYKLDYSFTANGDYIKINLTDSFESVQWTDLSKAKLVSSDGKTIAGTFKVLDSTGKDVTTNYNKHTYQTDGKKEALQLVFTPSKISDLTALASKSDKDALVKVSLLLDDVTIKGASDAEVKLYTDSKGNIDVPNVGALATTSKTDTGGNTLDQVTKSNKVDVKVTGNDPTNPPTSSPTSNPENPNNIGNSGKTLPVTGDMAMKGLMNLGLVLLVLAGVLKRKFILEKVTKIFHKFASK